MDEKGIKLDLLDDEVIRTDNYDDDRQGKTENTVKKTIANNTEFVQLSQAKTKSQQPKPESKPDRPQPKPGAISRFVRLAKPKTKKIKRALKANRKFITVGVTLLAIVTVAIVSIGLIRQGIVANQPVNITKFETVRSLGRLVQDAPVKTEFNDSEPIAFRINYENAKVGTVLSYELINSSDGNVIRDGKLQTLRDDANEPADGERFMSLVSQANTRLSAGGYVIKLMVDGVEIAKHGFNVK